MSKPITLYDQACATHGTTQCRPCWPSRLAASRAAAHLGLATPAPTARVTTPKSAPAPARTLSALERLNAKASEIHAANPGMTKADAFCEASKRNPALYAETRALTRNGYGKTVRR